MLDSWGDENSPYDLNSDGTVNLDDLLAFLAQMPRGNTEEPVVDDQSDSLTASDSLKNADAVEEVAPPELEQPPANQSGAVTGSEEEAQTTNPHIPLTLEGLLNAWGEENSQYDLTGDGRVDLDDLLTFLANDQGADVGNHPAPPTEVSDIGIRSSKEPDSSTTGLESAPAGPSEALHASDEEMQTTITHDPLTLDGLLKAWGEENSQYDLNGDGTVDLNDLLTFLANDQGADVGNHPASPPDEPITAERKMTLQGLLDAWGADDSFYDLNKDGTVNLDDLLSMLANMRESGETPQIPENLLDMLRANDNQRLSNEGGREPLNQGRRDCGNNPERVSAHRSEDQAATRQPRL